MKTNIRLAIHGGAGTLRREQFTPEREALYLAALHTALKAGYDILEQNGTAVDAVEAAVLTLEDSPLFNAGKGAVLTHTGHVEMDAAIMDGRTLQAGAVASVTAVRNPIRAARAVMEQSEHVFLIGQGADEFCREKNLPTESQEYFKTEDRVKQWELLRGSEKMVLDHTADMLERKYGTVGAVALDAAGNLAAATSTGGMSNKKHGRVGDSPLIGIGTYASNSSCAVSATGYGEYFIRAVCAHDIAAMIEYGGMSIHEAVSNNLNKIADLGGDGGVVALDANGDLALLFNSEGMYRGWSDEDGKLHTAIFEMKEGKVP
jgi:beta-aspartyl-peptidase (threonine type)